VGGYPSTAQVSIVGVDAWREACAQAYVPLRIDAIGEDFRGALRQRVVGGLDISQIASTPLTLTRTARSVATDPRETVMFCTFLAGAGVTLQDGRIAALSSGGGFLMDDDRPYSMRYERNDLLVLRLPRARLDLRERDLRQLTSAPMSNEFGGLHVLRRYLAGLVAMDAAIRDAEVEEHQELALELLHVAVHPMVYSERSRALMSGQAILVTARWFLEHHHADPRLTIDDVARHFMISRRYLEMLFTRSGDGPATYLRRVRLHRAAALLLARPREPVSRIAAEVGFTNINTFARAFARDFGTPPHRWRRDQADRPQTPPRGSGQAGELLTNLERYDRSAPGSTR